MKERLELVKWISFAALIAVASCLLSCEEDSDCRRNTCIFGSCRPPSMNGFPCDSDRDCYSSTDICSVDTCERLVWTTEASLPILTNGGAAGVIDGSIYALGGFISYPGSTSQTQKYIISPGFWDASASSLPEASPTTLFPAYVVLDNKIILIGGSLSDFSVTNAVRSFDGSTFTNLPNLPASLQAACASVYNGKIYVFGGITSFISLSILNALYIFDPSVGAQGTWSTGASVPEGTGACAASTFGDAIYVFGGSSPNFSARNRILKYYPLTNTWETLSATLSLARDTLSSVVLSTKIYIIGGSPGQDQVSDRTDRFDPATETIVAIDNLPAARAGTAAVASGDSIYVIGGFSSPYEGTTSFFRLAPA